MTFALYRCQSCGTESRFPPKGGTCDDCDSVFVSEVTGNDEDIEFVAEI